MFGIVLYIGHTPPRRIDLSLFFVHSLRTFMESFGKSNETPDFVVARALFDQPGALPPVPKFSARKPSAVVDAPTQQTRASKPPGADLMRAATSPNLTIQLDRVATDRRRLEDEKAAILRRLAELRSPSKTTTPATAAPTTTTRFEEEERNMYDEMPPAPASLPTSPKLPPLLSMEQQRATKDFPLEIQKLLKKQVVLGGVDQESEEDAHRAAAEIAAEIGRLKTHEAPSSEETATRDSGSSTSSAQSSSSRPLTVIYRHTQEPELAIQMTGTLRSTQDALCKYGWKCWQSNSCGGRHEGQRFIHRESLLPNDENHQGQYALCRSFLRRFPKSTEPYSSEQYVQHLDRYVATNMKTHPSASASLVESDYFDQTALDFIARCSAADGHSVELLRVSKGMFLLAAIYLGLVSTDALASSKGPNLPLNVALPLSREGSRLSTAPNSANSSREGSRVTRIQEEDAAAAVEAKKRSDSPLRSLANKLKRTVSLGRLSSAGAVHKNSVNN